MSAKRNVGVLISGRGSNLQALIDASRSPDYPAEIVLVISNVADALGLERAKAAGIPTAVIDHKKHKSREAFDKAVDALLQEAGVEIVCLAGFMRILTPEFVRKWEGRLINIHPSLLPDFKGTHVHEQVIEAGVGKSGCTVHYVTADLDSGPIIAQSEAPVLATDTPETLAESVLQLEHSLYPDALRLVAEGKVRLENGKARFAKSSQSMKARSEQRPVDEQLRFAIANKRLIQIEYAGSTRIVEPHDYGVQKGVERLLGYQQQGSSGVGWRVFDVLKIESCSVLAEGFAGSRGASHRQHKTWDTVYARVS